MGNQISFMGHLGRDPELKEVGQTTVLEFNVASSVGWGERKVTNWFTCQYWGKRGQSLLGHLQKGSKVLIFGELTLRKYETRDQEKRISPDIRVNSLEFCGSREESGPSPSPEPSSQLSTSRLQAFWAVGLSRLASMTVDVEPNLPPP